MENLKQKKCFKCGEVKELTSFYKHKQMSDGHVNKCIDCNKNDINVHRKLNIDKINKYDRERYFKNGSRSSIEYLLSKEHRDSKNKSSLKWNEKNRYKKQCYSLVRNALKNGAITKYPCLVCGDKNSHGHHWDYNKPLDVEWLCNLHHKKLHLELYYNEEERKFYKKCKKK